MNFISIIIVGLDDLINWGDVYGYLMRSSSLKMDQIIN
jgi:hypothetical protein